MPRKRKPKKFPEIVAGRAKRAYSGKRLERLRKTAERLVDKKLDHLREKVRSADDDVSRAVKLKAVQTGWQSKLSKQQLEIGVVRAQLREAFANREYALAFIDLNKSFGRLVEFGEEKIKYQRQELAFATKQINSLQERLERLKEKEAGRRDNWKKGFRSLLNFVKKEPNFKKKLQALKAREMNARRRVKGAKISTENQRRILRYKQFNGRITDKQFQQEIKRLNLYLRTEIIALSEAQEDLWIFWHRIATLNKDELGISKLVVQEIARRRHNATFEKVKAKKTFKQKNK